MRSIPLIARAAGVRLGRVEHVGVEDAAAVARWLSANRDAAGVSVLRTCASAGVRVAEAAAANNIDLSGAVMFVGGEPLTPARRRAIEAVQARAVPLYGATEIGYVAGSCARPTACDDLHVFTDRLAVTTLRREVAAVAIESLLLTSVSLNGGAVILNAELGDYARLQRLGAAVPWVSWDSTCTSRESGATRS